MLKNGLAIIGFVFSICLVAAASSFVWNIYAPPRLTIDENGVERFRGPGIHGVQDGQAKGGELKIEYLNMASIKFLQEQAERRNSIIDFSDGDVYGSILAEINDNMQRQGISNYQEFVDKNFKRFIFF